MTTYRFTSAAAVLAALAFVSSGLSATDAKPSHTPVPILMYHVIADPPADAPYPHLYVSERDFAGQMRWLARRGYRAITQRQVWNHWHRGSALPPKPVVISFDDGYRSVAEAAWPHLQRRSWPGVLNLTVKNLQVSGGISQYKVRRLLADGWELASHTLTHPDLPGLGARSSDARGVALASRAPGEVRRPGRLLLLPRRPLRRARDPAVRRAGYLGATTTLEGLARPTEPYELRRVRVSRGDGCRGLAEKLS